MSGYPNLTNMAAGIDTGNYAEIMDEARAALAEIERLTERLAVVNRELAEAQRACDYERQRRQEDEGVWLETRSANERATREIEKLRAIAALNYRRCSDCNGELTACGPMSFDGPSEDCLVCLLRSDITRLRAIVGKLPKTADSVPITPWMNLYSNKVDYDFGCVGLNAEEPESILCRDTRGVEFTLDASDCYSTREAAEAAMKATTKEHT